MKRLTLLFIFFSFFGASLFAQEDVQESKNVQHEFGVNISYLFRNIFGANDNIDLEDNYMLTYKMHFNKVSLRLGLGGNFTTSLHKETTDQLVNIERKNTAQLLNARLGLEYQKTFAKNWIYYLGVDGLYKIFNEKVDTSTADDIQTSARNKTSVGGGPILGFQYYINKQLALGTEAGVAYLFNKETTELEFMNFPELNNTNSDTSENFEFISPVNLYLSVRF